MAGLLERFTDGAFKGGFTDARFQFPTNRAPYSQVRRLGPQQQQVFPGRIFEEHQDSDFMRER
jgi:hypothetical protein